MKNLTILFFLQATESSKGDKSERKVKRKKSKDKAKKGPRLSRSDL